MAYVGAATTKACVLALVTLATAALLVDVSIAHPILMLVFLVAISAGFCLLGFAIGIWAKNFEQLQVVPLLVVTPLTFLGGVFYSVSALGEPWRTVTQLNPILYLVSGFRWTFFGTADVPLARERGGDGRCDPAPARRDRMDFPHRLSAQELALLVGAAGALAVEVLGDEVPVDDVLEHGLEEARALVAIVDVIGMLPHIEREQRRHAMDDRACRRRGATSLRACHC